MAMETASTRVESLRAGVKVISSSTGSRREELSMSFTRLSSGWVFDLAGVAQRPQQAMRQMTPSETRRSSQPENMGNSAMVWEVPTVNMLKGAEAKAMRQAKPEMAMPTSAS